VIVLRRSGAIYILRNLLPLFLLALVVYTLRLSVAFVPIAPVPNVHSRKVPAT
jgi:hypothetical protein